MMFDFLKLLFRKHQIPLAETELFFRVLTKGKVLSFHFAKSSKYKRRCRLLVKKCIYMDTIEERGGQCERYPSQEVTKIIRKTDPSIFFLLYNTLCSMPS